MSTRCAWLVVATVVAAGAGTSPASAAPAVVAGHVAATRAWRTADGETVTESVIRSPTCDTTVIQLGGVVDGIGMRYSHQPQVLRTGDDVIVEAAAPRAGAVAAMAVRAVRGISSHADAGTASYAVQRTDQSTVALWRDTGCLTLIYDTVTVSEVIGHAIDDAFATWTHATSGCSTLSFTSARAVIASAGADGLSTVHVRTDRWCRPATASEPELCFPSDAAAVTRLVYVDDVRGADDGKILEADMELNAVDFVLVPPGVDPPLAGARPALDLISVVTHEAGHVLGLAHDCGTGLEDWPTDLASQRVPACAGLAPDSSVRAATMYVRIEPGDISKRTLEASDAAGACALVRGRTCEPVVSGGCAAGGGASPAAVLGLLALAARRRRCVPRARRSCRPIRVISPRCRSNAASPSSSAPVPSSRAASTRRFARVARSAPIRCSSPAARARGSPTPTATSTSI